MKTRLILLLTFAHVFTVILTPLPVGASNLPPETHPCILYADQEMIDTILDRLTREPYAGWWDEVDGMLSWIVNINFSTATELQKSRYSKLLAFGYVMTDSLLYAEKALEGLSLIDPDGNWGGSSNYYAHADPMTFYCETYDILKGAGYPIGEAESYIRDSIAEKADEFYNNIIMFLLYHNNWRIRYYAALGTAAFTLADHPDAEIWHDMAEANVRGVFYTHQGVGEGAWAEGPYYQMYSARIYMPYLITFNRLITTDDMLNEEPVQAVHDWNWMIRTPDSQRPNYEDSQLEFFFSDYFAPVTEVNSEIFQWDFLNVPDPDDLNATTYWIPDAICYYDDTYPAEPPDIEPTIFLPESGNMIFRSGWDTDDIYFFLIGEHGDARIKGEAHDHPDGTSFILCAYGEYLGLDAGYISWGNRSSVNKALNHSLILVDGQGPSTPTSSASSNEDSYLKNYYDIGGLQFCTDSTFYQNTSIRRDVLFVDKELFVIRDRVDASATHTYNWRLHGNGGETSGGAFELNDNIGKWERENASLYAGVDAEISLSFSTTPDTHSFSYLEILTHSTLDAECTAEDIDFLSILHPIPAGAAEPVIESLDFSNGSAFKLGNGVAASNSTGQIFTVPESQTGFPSFTALADFLYCGFAYDELDKFDMHYGQVLICDGFECFSSEIPINFSLVKSGLTWQAYISGSGQFSINLYIGSPEEPGITYNGDPVEFTYQNGTATIELTDKGLLEITIPISTVENVRIAIANGLPVITWDPVFGASSYKIYRDTTPYFTPSPANLVDSSSENTWTESEGITDNYFYVVTAVYE